VAAVTEINISIYGNMVASAILKVRQENNQRYCFK